MSSYTCLSMSSGVFAGEILTRLPRNPTARFTWLRTRNSVLSWEGPEKRESREFGTDFSYRQTQTFKVAFER